MARLAAINESMHEISSIVTWRPEGMRDRTLSRVAGGAWSSLMSRSRWIVDRLETASDPFMKGAWYGLFAPEPKTDLFCAQHQYLHNLEKFSLCRIRATREGCSPPLHVIIARGTLAEPPPERAPPLSDSYCCARIAACSRSRSPLAVRRAVGEHAYSVRPTLYSTLEETCFLCFYLA
jgi:hypothetical protein